MSSHQLKYWNAFNLMPEIGSIRLSRLISHFSHLEEAWQANFQELRKARLEEKIIEAIITQRNKINPDQEWEKLEKNNIKIITIQDPNYPKLLKEIYNPPVFLYLKGKIKPEDELSLAVVGTRKISAYGKQTTPEIVKELVQAQITIVSGLALGIDALAHQSALDNKGRTIAVLGSGLDNIYPISNRSLAQEILESEGAIISEYPLGTLPLRHHFPHRNRIIAGLTLGTLIIEAGEDSGALITGRYALEQNREVFAVPGNIYQKNSQGPNNLIKMGAKLVNTGQDVLDALNLNLVSQFRKNQKIIADTKEEEILLKYLSREPIHIDQLVKESKLNAAMVNSTLTMMEMKGRVKNLGSMNYVLAR